KGKKVYCLHCTLLIVICIYNKKKVNKVLNLLPQQIMSPNISLVAEIIFLFIKVNIAIKRLYDKYCEFTAIFFYSFPPHPSRLIVFPIPSSHPSAIGSAPLSSSLVSSSPPSLKLT